MEISCDTVVNTPEGINSFGRLDVPVIVANQYINPQVKWTMTSILPRQLW